VNTSVKYPSGPYKPGAAAGGAPGGSAYGGYSAGPAAYGGAPAVSSANATGYEDLSASQYKESNLYIPGQQVRVYVIPGAYNRAVECEDIQTKVTPG
jgi:hypothetical protein